MNEPGEGHIIKAWDGALAGLRERAHEMGRLVAAQVGTAVRALLESDREAAELVLRRELQINAWQTEIEAESFRLLARQAPVASDLRTVLAISRAVTDLERAGDESKKIARFALASSRQGSAGPSRVMHRPLRHMAELASESMRVAVDALDRGDASVAHDVARLDREIDQEFEAALRQLMTVAMERSRLLKPVFDTVFALKSLERIGDHAKNVAEHVVFLVSGDDVRHLRAAADLPARESQH
ncbi:MAG TPA: phosphate signaling complex protein PhoU [Steroidobacteraceae bacterium]|nr:phosphate signaling complex protein PhoU [Steroidobacteraceae bacterium]